MSNQGTLKEADLLPLVLSKFEGHGYWAYPEAKLGRKHIDVLFIPQLQAPWIAVELKVRNWKRALWQASVNTQVAEKSYIALWDKFTSPAMAHRELFELYGVGIISVSLTEVSIVLESGTMHNLTRQRQQFLIACALGCQLKNLKSN